MNTIRTIIVAALIPVLTAIPSAFALQALEEQGTAVVGHLTHVEGNLLRYIDDDEEWVPMVKDSPVGAEDLLLCEDDQRLNSSYPITPGSGPGAIPDFTSPPWNRIDPKWRLTREWRAFTTKALIPP